MVKPRQFSNDSRLFVFALPGTLSRRSQPAQGLTQGMQKTRKRIPSASASSVNSAVKPAISYRTERAIRGAPVDSCPFKSTCALTHALTCALEKPHFSHEISTYALLRQFWTISAVGSGSLRAAASVSAIPGRRFSHVSPMIPDFSCSRYAGQVDDGQAKETGAKKNDRITRIQPADRLTGGKADGKGTLIGTNQRE